MKIDRAIEYANFFMGRLAPACHRIEIVGSTKRQDKNEVHDIELLLIPKDQRPVPEFGRPNSVYKNTLEKILADLHYEELLRHAIDKKDGERYKKRAIVGAEIGNDFCLELWIVTPATWGIQNVIRTGPALFGHRFVANRSQKIYDKQLNREFSGFLPDHLEYIKGETAIKPRNAMGLNLPLQLPEESDAIELLGFGWIPAQKRGFYALNK